MSIDFRNSKRGELNELRMELSSIKVARKKEALKKVIASMTLGKDVSSLFTDVLKCMDTPSIEIKKLVYLYIINYAKSQPELAILAVNTFRKDAKEERANPLMRGLAVRTMACIGVEGIIDYLCDPLKGALNDEDPYVRKTAAISVAKLYEISPESCEELEFVERLVDLLSDGNAMVVSNAVAALAEISSRRINQDPIIEMDGSLLHKLLTALSECTEWGRIYILDFLAIHLPVDLREIESAVQRVVPHLSHSNAAVVLSAAKVLIRYMDYIDDEDKIKSICRKLSPPLVSLMSSNPEIQYIAIKNINLIVQKRGEIFARGEDMRVCFFCNFNDPLYVKVEKLEIMIRLVDIKSVDQFLHEAKEYAQELDVTFVRKAVSAIGRCAIKLEKAADRCVQALIELVRTRVDYLVQESVKVIKDILRRYPNRYESIIKDFCDNLKALNFADERAAMIWIIGEYADRNITNAVPLIESFAENFKEEAPAVQQAILTAAVKVFLKLEDEAEAMIVDILKLATEEAENPDLRNRGYVYWRMLTADPDMARQVILEGDKTISDHSQNIDPGLLDDLVMYLGTLCSINMRLPQRIVTAVERDNERFDLETGEEVEEIDEVEDSTGMKRSEYKGEAPVETFIHDLIGLGDDTQKAPTEEKKHGGGLDLIDEVLGLSAPASQSQSQAPTSSTLDNDPNDLLGVGSTVSSEPSSQYCRVPEKVVLSEDDEASKTGRSGLKITASFQRINQKLILEMNIQNTLSETVDDFAIKFNKNSFGLEPAESLPDISISSHASKKVAIEIDVNENNSNQAPGMPILIDCALKTSIGIFVFQMPVMLSVLIIKSSTMVNVKEIRQLWKNIETEDTMYYTVKNLSISLTSPQSIKERLLDHNIVFIEEGRNSQGSPCLYFTAKTTNGHTLIVQLTFKDGICTICVKAKASSLISLTQQAVNFILSQD